MTSVDALLQGLDGEQLRELMAKAGALLGQGGDTRRAGDLGAGRAGLMGAAGNVKHLEPAELELLTASFRNWLEAARPAHRQSRLRMWLVYLLLRHTGARLGEVLAFNDLRDFNAGASSVLFRGEDIQGGGLPGCGHGREVRLSAGVAEEIAVLLADPVLDEVRGQLAAMDQGFVRRKFQERGRVCGLPPDMSNPRTLRHSRAVELLRGGMPLPIVQDILGNCSVNLTANYLCFSDEDKKRIIQLHIKREEAMKTSARNTFAGVVSASEASGVLAEVELVTPSGLRVVSVITRGSLDKLGLIVGSSAVALVKAPHVLLARPGEAPAISARNVYPGRVVSVKGEGLAAEVVVALPTGEEICAVVTGQSRKALDLVEGDPVLAFFKAFSVILVQS